VILRSSEGDMVFGNTAQKSIIDQLLALPFWQDFWDRTSVAVVGSIGAGLGDEHSDLDVQILVSGADYRRLYELYKEAWEAGVVEVLNPRAFLFDEFPLMYLNGVDGHYQVMAYEPIADKVRSFDDVERWVYANSISILDAGGWLAALRDESEHYPADILNEKLSHHYYQCMNNFWPTKGPLERGQKEPVSILCAQGISHVLKFCILADGRPFPYDKWLYAVAVETRLGRLLRPYIDAIFAEIHRDRIVYEKPESYIKPGDRNEQYENYRIYYQFLAMRQALDAHRQKLLTKGGVQH
jgi:hypothetical protein